nr:hypothetical protein [Sphaerisporangium melleum]
MTIAAALLLGAFHGLNPAMGWLFAVARGLQEHSRTRLLWSLPAIAAGHLAAVVAVALAGDLGIAALHTLAMFTAAGVVALVVYEVAGLTVLRRAWFNLDRMWAAALVAAGLLTLAQA